MAPLNWGLGHATRCIPVIEALENQGYTPVIASDGAALEFLKKEFPHLSAFELPPYHIEYARNGSILKPKLLMQLPGMLRAIRNENEIVARIIKQENISGIISDNRLGANNRSVPSIFITHQVNILSGNTTWLTTSMHRSYLKKYTECWVPDLASSVNLSGKIGHSDDYDSLRLKYIGPLSRLHKKPTQRKYDLMVLLSGPEPQRAILEEKLIRELQHYNGYVVFVRGVVEGEETIYAEGRITYYNFMNTATLEQAFNDCEMVLCRPGYTTIMDLAKLCKKAFFIPTPGMSEQEYLAKKLKKAGMAPYASQNNFKIADLQKALMYKGLRNMGENIKWKDLFSLFEREGKL